MTSTDLTFSTTPADDAAQTPMTPGQIFRQRLFGHTGFLIGAGLILVIVVIAIFAPLIAPHDPYAQSLSARMLPPVWVEGGN